MHSKCFLKIFKFPIYRLLLLKKKSRKNMMNYPDKRLISIDSPGARATFLYSILSFSIQ